MKTKIRNVLCGLIVGLLALIAGTASSNATLVLRLQAADYDPATGTWTDTSGQGNNAIQGNVSLRPSLATNVTGNGSSVVRFGPFHNFALSGIFTPSNADGFTIFVYTRPTPAGVIGDKAFLGGTLSSPAYILRNGKPYIGRQSLQVIGLANTALSTSEFSNINVKVNDAGASFRLNGSPDGSVTPGANAAFAGIFNIGCNCSVGFLGDIAEIRIYNSQLTADEIAWVELELNIAYALPFNVPVCHKRLTTLNLLSNSSELRRHLGHGDTLGACTIPRAGESQ